MFKWRRKPLPNNHRSHPVRELIVQFRPIRTLYWLALIALAWYLYGLGAVAILVAAGIDVRLR